MELIDKEVYFNQYCKKCKYREMPEDHEPCHWCLQYPSNTYSHRPVYWEGSRGNEDYVAPEHEE